MASYTTRLYIVTAIIKLVAAALYHLDTTWPQAGAFSRYPGIAEITAIAIVPVGGNKEIHVAQRNASFPFVIVLNTAGAITSAWGDIGDIVSPHGLQVGSGSTIWCVDISGFDAIQVDVVSRKVLNSVGTYRKSGAGLTPPQFSAPADIAFTQTGDIVIADGDGGKNNRVLVIDGKNTSRTKYQLTGFSSPHSVAYETIGNRLWIADRGHATLRAFNATSGAAVGSWNVSTECVSSTQGIAPNAAPWGVRIDEARGIIALADGNIGALYTLSLPPPGKDIGQCKLIQNITVGLDLKPHLLGLDPDTGDIYLANVGVPPTAQRYILQ